MHLRAPESIVELGDKLGSLRELFDAVTDIPVADRDRWLALNVKDERLHAALLELLAADSQNGFLETPAEQLHSRIKIADGGAEGLLGREVGGFRLVRVLGQGGMAMVFLGERVGRDFTQRAAIKILRRGLYSELEQRLFLRERRVLASLEHPNIARLIDGGVTDAGIPYLVLDYVDGVPITRYADAGNLDVSRRLALFLAVCSAVEAAHRALIVHRDIKPSNILVTESNDVKLLDFGIAKLIEEDSDATGTFGVFTRDYAAPEQLRGGAITTATDVYGLGVLLYELLLGRKPDIEGEEGGDLRRPSSQIEKLAEGAADAPQRAHTADQLRRILRGDLDNIVLKALDPEPARRYPSAGALADDISRHLSGRPVIAHPPTRWYRTRKFIQRHRGGVTITATLVLAVVAALSLALWQTGVAKRQSEVAQAQTARAEATKDLLVGLFNNEIPERPRNALPDTATLLAEGATRARDELAATPGVQSELLMALGHVYTELSQFDKSEPLLDQAVDVARRIEPADPALLGAALSEHGDLDLKRNHYPQALALYDEAIELQRHADPQGLALARTLVSRGETLSESSKHDAAIVDLRAALEIREQHLARDDLKVLDVNEKIGTAYDRNGRHAEAAEYLRNAMEAARAKLGEAHVTTTRYMKNYATNLVSRHDYVQAIALTEKAVQIESSLYPKGHPAVGNGINNLGYLYYYTGRLRAALETLAKVRDLNRDAGLAKSRGQIVVLTNLAAVHEILGDSADATALLEEALRMAREVIGADNEFVRRLVMRSARVQFDLKRDDESARVLLAAAQPIALSPEKSGQLRTGDEIDALVAIGRAQSVLGYDAEAQAALRSAVAKLPPDHVDPLRMQAVIALAVWERAHDRAGEAESMLRDFIARASREFASTHYALGELQLALAELLVAANRSAEAAPALAAARDAFVELADSHSWRRRVAELAGQLTH